MVEFLAVKLVKEAPTNKESWQYQHRWRWYHILLEFDLAFSAFSNSMDTINDFLWLYQMLWMMWKGISNSLKSQNGMNMLNTIGPCVDETLNIACVLLHGFLRRKQI
jgi:hypothetical protein